MLNVVIDTNVVISGIFFRGKPLIILRKVIEGSITAFATPEIIAEYYEIFHRIIDTGKAKNTPSDNVLTIFVSALCCIENTHNIQVCRDKDDNKFLNCAKSCHAEYIVSGDNDLLVIKEYENIEIINVEQFLELTARN